MANIKNIEVVDLTTLKSKIEATASLATSRMNSGAADEDIKAAKKAVTKAVQAYNAAVTNNKYAAWGMEESPMKAAMMARYVPGLVEVKYASIKGTNRKRAEVKEIGNVKAAKVSLLGMEEAMGAAAFHAEGWFDSAQHFADVLNLSVNHDLTGDARFMADVRSAAAYFGIKSDADPVSKRSLTAALQKCVDDILYIDNDGKNAIKMDTRDLARLRESVTSEGNGTNDVNFVGYAHMTSLIADALHNRLVALIGGTDVQYVLNAEKD